MKMNSTENNAICHISYTEVYEQKEVIIRAGRKLGWDYASCDDLVQEVAIKCWKNPKIQYDSAKGTKKSLLARIAHNTGYDKGVMTELGAVNVMTGVYI